MLGQKHFIQRRAVVFSTSSSMAFTQAQQNQFTDVGHLCAGVCKGSYKRGQNSLRKLQILRIYFNLPWRKHHLESTKPSLPPPPNSMLLWRSDDDLTLFSAAEQHWWGGGGRAVLLTYHCSAQIWRLTNSFLILLSTIVAYRGGLINNPSKNVCRW